MRISDWSSDVCASDLIAAAPTPPTNHSRTGPAAHAQEPPHRRIAAHGQDDQQVPGQGLHRPGVVRPRPRPAAHGGRGRPGARLPHALRPARSHLSPPRLPLLSFPFLPRLLPVPPPFLIFFSSF